MAEAAKKPDEIVVADGTNRSRQQASQKHVPHKDLGSFVVAAINNPDYDSLRELCVSGEINGLYKMVNDNNKALPKNQKKAPNPPVGQMCVALLEHSTEATLNPSKNKDLPEDSLLAPYMKMVADKGFAKNIEGGGALLSSYTSAIEKPASQKLSPNGNLTAHGHQFPFNTATVFEASYSQTVYDAINNQKKPALSLKSESKLHEVADKCFALKADSVSECQEAAQGLAALKLSRVTQQSSVSADTLPASIQRPIKAKVIN